LSLEYKDSSLSILLSRNQLIVHHFAHDLRATDLEGTPPEGDFEVLGLCSEEDFMDVELVWPADDLAVGMFSGAVAPWKD
jgi:hypothetical protein